MVRDVLAALEERGLKVWADGDQLRFKGPPHPDNAADLEILKSNRTETLALLAEDPGNVAKKRPARLPLTIAQRGFFLPDLDRVPWGLRRTPTTLRLQGVVDTPALQQALHQLTERHEVLRTRYERDKKGAFQEVLDHDGPELTVIDLRDRPGPSQVDAMIDMLRVPCQEAPDHSAGRPLQAWLFHFDESNSIFAAVVDHVALDNRSMQVILRNLFAFYLANVRKTEPNLPPIEVHYADYALAVQPIQSREKIEKNLLQWQEVLGDTRPVNLRRPGAATGPGLSSRGVCPIHVHHGLTKPLRAFARDQGVTVSMISIAALSALLGRWARTDRVLAGYVVDGRPAKFAEVVGSFIRTQPLLLDISGDPTGLELIERARQAYLAAIDPQRMIEPYEIPGLNYVVMNLQRRRGFRLPEAVRQHINGSNPADAPELPPPPPIMDPEGSKILQVNVFRSPKPLIELMSLDMHINLMEYDDVLSGHILYAADRLDEERARWFARAINIVMQRFVHNSGAPISILAPGLDA